MANTIILKTSSNEHRQVDGVQYAEIAQHSQDKTNGVAIQFDDGSTAFEESAQIVGIYPENEFNPLDDDYYALLGTGQV